MNARRLHRCVALSRLLVLSAVLLGVAGCGGSPTASPASGSSQAAVASGQVSIDIRNFNFQPASLSVKAGTVVTWTNRDPQGTSHTATADQGAFDTGPIAPGAAASTTLSSAGTYTYHCNVHQYMTATITVVS